MNLDELSSDPIYQLNLMLWLLQPLKDDYPLRPILKEAGYELFAIAPPMPITPELRERIIANKIQSSLEPEPDLLINKGGIQSFVILECKRQLFGAESSTAEQLRGLLLQSNEQFNLAIGLERTATPLVNLIYIARHVDDANFTQGLHDVKNSLQARNFTVLPIGAMGISFRENNIYLRNGYSNDILPDDIKTIVNNEILIQAFEQDEDPIPLFYVPWDPNVSQSSEMAEYCERVFLERLLAAFIVKVGKSYISASVEIYYDDLLNDATMGFYEKWRSKTIGRSLRGSVRDLINDILQSAGDTFNKEVLPPPRSGMKLFVSTEEQKERLIDAVTRLKRTKGWIKIGETQAMLFDSNEV